MIDGRALEFLCFQKGIRVRACREDQSSIAVYIARGTTQPSVRSSATMSLVLEVEVIPARGKHDKSRVRSLREGIVWIVF